ncbi:MAG: hypothetical protein VKL97_03575 [Cyanobacteriota bacterium]|nr:hypothetical protein [Cyanobacteriota bacterium]
MPVVSSPLPMQAAPELVVLLRHGHKDRPAESAVEPNYNLSATGFAQALQLARLVPACLQQRRRLRLISYGFDPQSGKNARSYQTLVPLAVTSGVNIRLMQGAANDSEAIGRQLRQDRELDGAVVVIAWEHRRLPLLAKGLGWSGMTPVDEGDFDSLWLLRYPAGGGTPAVEVRSQQGLQSQGCDRAGRQPS